MNSALKDRRSELGKELREIAEVTRIKCSYLKSIEEDEFAKLPVEVYTRGYIREYAEFLGILPDAALEPYEKYLREKKGGKEKVTPHEKQVAVLTKEVIEGLDDFKGSVDPGDTDTMLSPGAKFSSNQKALPVKLLWALPVLVIAAGIYFIMPVMKTVPPPSPPRNQQTAQAPQPAPPVVTQNTQTPSVLPSLPDSNTVVKAPQVPENVKPEEKQPLRKDTTRETKDKALTAQAKPESPVEKSATAKKKHTLKINATDKVWIKVVIDGKENKQLTLHQGDTVSYGADQSVALTVGNAAGARIVFDGKSLENLGADGEVVKLSLPSSGSSSTSHQPVPVEPTKEAPDDSKH